MTAYSSNQHCVEKLLVLSESHAVVATQDIYDDQGFKLLAKGASVSRDLQDRLLLRKLKAPLEASLSVHDGVTVGELLQGAVELIEEIPALGCIAGNRFARELLKEGKKLHIPPPLTLLMTCARNTDADHYRHTQIAAAVCAGIAASLQASASDAQILLMAAILHDLGEIYVNPDYLHPQRHLSPQEWKHVATHPHVGQLLIRNLTSLPASVGACVGQHHERQDGSGYPAQLCKTDQHPLSGWIAVADATAALVHRGETTGERISLAMRIVHEEFDRAAADVIVRAMYSHRQERQGSVPADCINQAHTLLERVTAAGDALNAVATSTNIDPLRAMCDKTLTLLHGFSKAMRATGILDADRLSSEDFGDQELLAEMQQVIAEVSWRLRNLARNLFLRVDAWQNADALSQVQLAIELLDAPVFSPAVAA